jgi:hypothetical protein
MKFFGNRCFSQVAFRVSAFFHPDVSKLGGIKQKNLLRSNDISFDLVDLETLKVGHTIPAAFVAQLFWNVQPFKHLNSSSRNGVDPAFRLLRVQIMENFSIGIADVSLPKVRRVQSANQSSPL